MYQKFFDTSSEKQDRIISAAVKEFALYGYDGASTNRIVADAGISKGILFHYFGNKQNLFEFIAEYVALVLIDDYYKKINMSQTDFFDQLQSILTLRFELSEFYPHVFMFYDRMKGDESEQVKPFLNNFKDYSFYEPFKRCDRSFFMPGSDFESIVCYTEWIISGFITKCSEMTLEKKEVEVTKFVTLYRRMLTGR